MDSLNRAGIIRRASLIALLGNALLGGIKIVLGFRGNSMAVVGDGIDSSVDVLLAILTLGVARVIARPADEDHPWGHGRAETVATALLACTLFFVGAQLILQGGRRLLSEGETALPTAPALAAAFISIVGKGLLALSQDLLGKKAGSAMLRANARNMAGDMFLSAGVLAGVALSIEFSLYFIDSLAAILVGFWVIKSALCIFREANQELMDGDAGAGSYQALYDAVRSVPEAGNPHRVRMRRIAGLWDIDLDIEVEPALTVLEAHGIAHRVEQAIKGRVEGVYDIVVHIEPRGNREQEGFGLREGAG
jgi:cation diffusion facilitator family transporter